MRKMLTVLSMVLVFAMLLSVPAFAVGTSTKTITGWDIQIKVPDDAISVLKGDSFYIYTKQDGTIPYVMVMVFNLVRDSDEAFFDELTDSMKDQYPDLRITSEPERKMIGNKQCCELDYGYKVSGYDVSDRRIITVHNGRTYMFTSKEVPELKLSVEGLLEDTVRTSAFLTEDEKDLLPNDIGGSEAETADAYMYLYCLENGMPKYWIDLTGTISPNPVLHCYFRSSDPTFYETWYILDFETAEFNGNIVTFHNVYDAHGFDVSDWFRSLVITEKPDCLVLSVVRNEKTMAGGGEDNVLNGEYVMNPMGSRVVYEYRDNGRLAYWLDQEKMALHKIIPDQDDEVYYLDLATAEWDGDYLVTIKKVCDSEGNDVSENFGSVMLSEVQGAILMVVDSRAKAENAIVPTNVYLLEPKTSFVPLKSGPYTADELGVMAQQYYMKNNGFFPPKADVTKNADGSFTIHLYEVVDLDGITHTATSAWYTVDSFGSGTDDIYETPVDLTE